MGEPNKANKKNAALDVDLVGAVAEEVAGEGILDGVGEVLGQAGEVIGGVLSDLPIDADISV